MSLYRGEKIEIEIFGESHAEKIGAIVRGMPETPLDMDELKKFLSRRKACDSVYSTTRTEEDMPIFDREIKGSIGGDFSFYILNKNIKKNDYKSLYGRPRPSHADYCSYLKDGTLDFSGGGRFSGRLTAPLCVVGGICMQYLSQKGINICAYISQTGKVRGVSYRDRVVTYNEIVKKVQGEYPSIDKKKEMLNEIERAREEKDSVGGKIECVVFGLKGGYGDSLFDGLEGKIAGLIYSIPAVKGVEFGYGFDLCAMRGSDCNDELYFDNKNQIKFYSNKSGGIYGGISSGEPITIGVAIKPTPSIAKTQRTVDLIKRENCSVEIGGRHDSCIVPRAVPCVESAVAIALADIV